MNAQLDWWHLFFQPLLKLEQAAELLDDVHKKHVVALAEEGRLRAVNIAVDPMTRRELRVWLYSVQWLGESDRRRVKQPAAPDVELLLPHARPNFRIHEVAAFLQCSPQHVENLRLDGPQFSPRHHRTSRAGLLRFLTTREINAL